MTDDPKKKKDAAKQAVIRQNLLRDLAEPPELRVFLEQQQRLRDLLDPPALRSIREQQQRLRDVMDPPVLRALREQQQRFCDLLDQPGLKAIREQQQRTRDLLESFAQRSERVVVDVPRFAELFGSAAVSVGAALQHAHFGSQAAIAQFAASAVAALAPRFADPSAQPSTTVLGAGVDFFASSFDREPAALVAEVPAEVFRALDLDMSLGGDVQPAVENERDEIHSRTLDELELALANHAPELVGLLSGAREAASSNNADRTRHVCVSLRELLGHAIRQLAPDPAVHQWTQNSAHFHEGRPTRRARLEFLYRHAAPSLRKFVAADVRAGLELFDALSNGTHAAVLEAGDAEMTILLSRAEGVLLLLLRLSVHPASGVYLRRTASRNE